MDGDTENGTPSHFLLWLRRLLRAGGIKQAGCSHLYVCESARACVCESITLHQVYMTPMNWQGHWVKDQRSRQPQRSIQILWTRYLLNRWRGFCQNLHKYFTQSRHELIKVTETLRGGILINGMTSTSSSPDKEFLGSGRTYFWVREVDHQCPRHWMVSSNDKTGEHPLLPNIPVVAKGISVLNSSQKFSGVRIDSTLLLQETHQEMR